MATFSNIVYDVTADNPQLDIYGLSASDNSVVLDTVGTYSGNTVQGILYSGITGAGTATVSLSTAGGVKFRVAPAYNGATFALYFTDRTSTLFTVATGTVTQTVTASVGMNIGPNELRLKALEII